MILEYGLSISSTVPILIKSTETWNGDSSTFYETVNINASTLIVDWGSFSWYDDPSKLESAFATDLNGDGEITTINSSQTTAVSTDRTGATLRQTTDGSLFIKDGDNTIQISSGDGGYVDFTFSEEWTGGSFSSAALAVQGIDSNSDGTIESYKLAIEETATFGGNTDIIYNVLTVSTAGVIDWSEQQFRTSAELNESEFDQDLNGDGVITQDDRTVIGCESPGYSYGFTLNIDYKNFDLGAIFQGVGDVQYNGTRRLWRPFLGQNTTVDTRWLNAWTPTNTDTTFPKIFDGSGGSDPGVNGTSDFWVLERDYLRLKNLQIGYTVPSDDLPVDYLRVYLNATNLFTFTDLPELVDPEGINGDSAARNLPNESDGSFFADEATIMPQQKTIQLGISIRI